MNFKTLISIAAIAAVTQVTGCTLVPMTASIDAPVATSKNPGGPAVKIVSATDNRQFVYPHQAEDCVTPTVDGEKMLTDEATKARAYARRGGCQAGEWGQHAMVMVPEGQTVAGTIKDAVVGGMALAGYAQDPSNDQAIPVAVDVKNFWVSRNFSFWSAEYTATVDIVLTINGTPIPVQQTISETVYWDGSGNYQKYGQRALDQLPSTVADKVRTALR